MERNWANLSRPGITTIFSRFTTQTRDDKRPRKRMDSRRVSCQYSRSFPTFFSQRRIPKMDLERRRFVSIDAACVTEAPFKKNEGCTVICNWRFEESRHFRELSSSDRMEGTRTVKWQGDISAWRSRKISKSTLLALMSRDADRLLAYGEMPARCVAKVGCRVADSEYVPEYVANRSMIDASPSMRQNHRPNFPLDSIFEGKFNNQICQSSTTRFLSSKV